MGILEHAGTEKLHSGAVQSHECNRQWRRRAGLARVRIRRGGDARPNSSDHARFVFDPEALSFSLLLGMGVVCGLSFRPPGQNCGLLLILLGQLAALRHAGLERYSCMALGLRIRNA
jgi:hypothetical protein